LDNYAETKQIINDMASVKMAMNSHKGKIENAEAGEILALMQHEMDELREAINSASLMDILQEAADVQNFLVALIQQQVIKYRSRKNVENS
tara:strand:+ start:236 stop:508 length:273 start_codon:yes stop_codon:yes gene_type:complete